MGDVKRPELRSYYRGATLDEPVMVTIMRDNCSFRHFLLQTVGWRQQEIAARNVWDFGFAWKHLNSSAQLLPVLASLISRFELSST